MIDIKDIEAIVASSKAYLADRKRYEKMSARGGDYSSMTQKAIQKLNADLGWAAMDLIKKEAQLHTDCVNAGLADMRDERHYSTRELHPSAWHKYNYTPPLPRCMEGAK